MFDALVNGRIDCGELTFEVAYYDIEELNRRAEAGETDVSKISYALLPEIQSRYTLLDSGSALGRGNGPVFVARLLSVADAFFDIFIINAAVRSEIFVPFREESI